MKVKIKKQNKRYGKRELHRNRPRQEGVCVHLQRLRIRALSAVYNAKEQPNQC